MSIPENPVEPTPVPDWPEPVPQRTQVPSVFRPAADEWMAAFPGQSASFNLIAQQTNQNAIFAQDRGAFAETKANESAGSATASADSATASSNSATLSMNWATTTGATVDGTEYSAKEWAIGETVPEGSARFHKDTAETAAAAAQSAAGLPAIEGKGGFALTVTPDEQGVEFTDLVGLRKYTEFTESGTFEKDPKARWIIFETVNGGNSGEVSMSTGSTAGAFGGAGGVSARRLIKAVDVPSSVSVIIGAGANGASRSGSTSGVASGNFGGRSRVVGIIESPLQTSGNGNVSRSPLSKSTVAGIQNGHNAGDGGWENSTSVGETVGGHCVIGGAGGAGLRNIGRAGGNSVNHGDGSSSTYVTDQDVVGLDGEFPGGGSGAVGIASITDFRNGVSGKGGDGVVRIWEY